MKVERMARSGHDLAPAADALQRLLAMGGAAHVLQHLRRGMLEGDVEIGKDLALGHQRDDVGDMRVGVDVVQAHPDAELAEFLGQIEELGAHLAVLEHGWSAYLMSTP